ncbi:MAG: hypothetical protein IJQ87_05700 [Clostridia bacterium]|nr:hypothetical protein [Clostridia bacterium]
MNAIPSSLFLGPLCLIGFFLISTVLVAGIKLLYLYFKREPIKFIPKKRKAPANKPQPVKAVKSIEINPDEVDKIYVKKVS